MSTIPAAGLERAVQVMLDSPDARVGPWEATSIKGTLPDERSVFRVEGSAHIGAAMRPWRVVLKVSKSDEGGAREAKLYNSGLLTKLTGLAAPRCYGTEERGGFTWLWLEDVADDGERWDIARWEWVARQLGRFNGAAARDPRFAQPRAAGGLQAWLATQERLIQLIVAAPSNPSVAQWWPQPIVDQLLEVWATRQVFVAALERLPRTFCHRDAIRRNLFVRGGELVAVDWEQAGWSTIGEEIGQTLSTTPAFFDVEVGDLPQLEDALLAGYLTGLAEAGWSGDIHQVRFAYIAHAGLHNLFNAVGTGLPPPGHPRWQAAVHTYGHTIDELAERRAELRPYLLGLVKRARELAADL